MSLEQWSAVAQILASFVGIPSLIFVGIQVNLMTKTVKASSSQAHAATYHSLSAAIADNSTGFAGIGSVDWAGPTLFRVTSESASLCSLGACSDSLNRPGSNGCENSSTESIGAASSNKPYSSQSSPV